ncbi:hypothetical protein NX801_17110 [Streptomyces sp. LP05-1]|uniref:Uncharacterized protein n=1 Tax=Streptomyces pyxinae TaxID=2970734 RepID=A0ABT2CIX4_9ACTN|nr:hypothetical protein [Streptomyces sp. LP05-1]MCS0637353.1 hypothetical protein [Streptomyces sp. LP05-1]
MSAMTVRRLAATAALTTALLTGAAPTALAAGAPGPAATTPDRAASAPGTLDTLARFFAQAGRSGTPSGAPSGAKAAAPAGAVAAPRIEGTAVPVYVLSPDFVAGRADAPVARVEFHAATAVAGDGRKASVWTVRQGTSWRVVNIATGDDETRYARQGARALPGGTVFREPQIDAWYVQKGTRVLPLDEDAARAVGARGTSLAAYRDRVRSAYGDKAPGSAYAKRGLAGGYGAPAAGTVPAPAPADRTAPAARAADAAGSSPAGTPAGTPLAVGGALALAAGALAGTRALRRRRTG